MNAIPAARETRRILSEFAVPSTPKGIVLFAADIAIYMAAIAVVLFVPWLPLKLFASIFAGIKIANLATLAHDASHNSLTASRPLNKLIAIIAFTPGLFSYRLWLYDHHHLHHNNTNGSHPDSFKPLSKKEFDALSSWGKFKLRVYRSNSIWVFGIYYIFERWWQVKFFPRRHMPKLVRHDAWLHFAYLLAYLAAFLAFLAAAPLYSATGSAEALLLGFVIPFYVFQSFFSFTVYVQHTHPRVSWFQGNPDRNEDGRQDLISVQLRFPNWFSYLAHHVYDHAAHHVHPAIPCYRLPEAQAKLNEILGAAAVSDTFSFAWLGQIQQRCKLYDYEHHRWLDFDARPSSRVTLVSKIDHTRQAWSTRALAMR